MTRAAKATWKYCLSFRKTDWELDDYPIETRRQESSPPFEGERWKRHAFRASVIRWHVVGGTGDSRSEAIAELKKDFDAEKARRAQRGKSMPRPGTSGPIEIAAQDRVDANPELLKDFIHRVLELDWALITDESSLWHFALGNQDDIDLYLQRIRRIYGVDVSEIESGNLAEILERIVAAKAGSNTRT